MSLAIPLKNDRSVGVVISALAHMALFFLGGFILSTPVEFAVESGSGGVEVDLVAGPTQPAAAEKDEAPAIEETAPSPAIEKSTAVPSTGGKDAVTFSSSGGAFMEAAPNYLRNPAPPYPIEARQKGWEGLVVLRVAVGADGSARAVTVDQSSGHVLLDESARSSVKKWRFRPAKAGGIAVDSSVIVPVRFSLKD